MAGHDALTAVRPHAPSYDVGAVQRKVLFQTFMHVNRELNDFQRAMLNKVIGPDATRDSIEEAITNLNQKLFLLGREQFKPARANSDPVLKPDHYDRFPMEPTYFIVESGGFHWCLENFIKYVVRYPFKNGIEDLNKALRNLGMYLKWLDGDPGWSR
jgi:hypothetical protein